MAATLQVGLQNNTKSGFSEIRQDAAQTGNAVEGMATSFRDASNAYERLSDDNEDLQNELQDLQHELDELKGDYEDLADEMRRSAAASKSLGQDGSKDAKSFGLSIISVNQALEIGKKLIEGAALVINDLADSGSPAFVRLRDSIGGVHESLIALADDPIIQDSINSLAQQIEEGLIPSIAAAGKAASDSWTGWKIGLTEIQLAMGMIDEQEAISHAMRIANQAANAESLKEQNRLIREQAEITEALSGIQERLKSSAEAAAIGRLDSERTIRDLIEDETDALKDLDRSSKTYTADKEAALKRLEALENRLVAVVQQNAQKEIDAQADIQNARAESEAAYREALKETANQAAEARKAVEQQKADAAQAVIDDLQKAIGEAESIRKSLLDDLRANFGDKEVGAALVDRSREAAKEKVIEQGRATGQIDQNGKAITREGENQAEAQARLNRQIRNAQEAAERDTRRNIARGNVSQDQYREVQNSLLVGNVRKNLGTMADQDPAFKALLAEMKAERQQNSSQRFNAASIGKLQAAATTNGNQGLTQGLADSTNATGNLAGATGNLAGKSAEALEQVAKEALNATNVANTASEKIDAILASMANTSARQRSQRGRYGQ